MENNVKKLPNSNGTSIPATSDGMRDCDDVCGCDCFSDLTDEKIQAALKDVKSWEPYVGKYLSTFCEHDWDTETDIRLAGNISHVRTCKKCKRYDEFDVTIGQWLHRGYAKIIQSEVK